MPLGKPGSTANPERIGFLAGATTVLTTQPCCFCRCLAQWNAAHGLYRVPN